MAIILGPPMPQIGSGHQMVDYKGDLYAFGVWFWDTVEGGKIYKLTCNYGDCNWTSINQKYKMGRGIAVAITVIDYLVNCTNNT